MRVVGVHRSILAAALMALAGTVAVTGIRTAAVAAEDKQEGVRDILFDSDHLKTVSEGAQLKYKFDRIVSEPKLLGPAFSDEIEVDVAKANAEGKHEVGVKIFTGERARDPRQLGGMTANPLLVFYLDRAISNYATLAGGSKGYLKNRFRLALRTTAKIEPVKVAYNGKTVDGYHVWVAPYVNDPNKEKMQGYQGSRFDVYVSDQVPGYLVELNSKFESSEPSAPKLDERIVLHGAEVKK